MIGLMELAHDWLPFSELLRNALLGLGAIFGLWLAWKRVTAANRQSDAALRQSEVALRQSELARRTHVAELFNKAVEQLVHERMEARLGAIFTLKQIGYDFEDLAGPTFQLLNAYLRQHSEAYPEGKQPQDIYEIVEIMKSRIIEP